MVAATARAAVFGQAPVLSHRIVLEDLALEDPDLDAAGAEGRERCGNAIIDVGAQRVQRHAAFAIPLHARDFGVATAFTTYGTCGVKVWIFKGEIMEHDSMRGSLKTGANVDAAKAVGKLVAQRAIEKGVKQVVFDRGGYLYHGRVKALADAARESGLSF